MKRFFTYFGFTKAERRGFSILVCMVFGVFLVSAGYSYLKKEHTIPHAVIYLPHQNNKVDGATNPRDERDRYPKKSKQKKVEPVFFEFDPNNLPEKEWKKMGFSDKQIAVIKNYEAKGGKFYNKEDVAKMYSISKQEYEQIEPYIVIKRERDKKTVPDGTKDKAINRAVSTIIEPIDINKADTTALKALKGIGSVLARRVIKYREALGGFYAVSQIGEVYGISPEVFGEIEPYLEVRDLLIKKLALNTGTKEQLSTHPYVSYKQASLIVNYRTQHGVFRSLEDLQNISVLGANFFRKIEPYIEF